MRVQVPNPPCVELRADEGSEPAYGPLIYRRLSSTIHGGPGPTRPVTAPLGTERGEDGYIAAQQSIRIEEPQMASCVASTAVVSAAMSLAGATGYCRHRVGLAPGQDAGGTVTGPRWWPLSDQSRALQCRSQPAAAAVSHADAGNPSAGGATEVVCCRTCPPQHPDAQAAFCAATGHRFPAKG